MNTETKEVAVMPESLARRDETRPLGFSVDADAVARFMERATPRQKAAVVADLLPEITRLVEIGSVYVRDWMDSRDMEAIPLGDGRKLELKPATPSVGPQVYQEGQRLLGEDGFGDEDESKKLWTETYSMPLTEEICKSLRLNLAELLEMGIAHKSGKAGGLVALKAAAKLGGPGGKFLDDQLEQAKDDAPKRLKVGGKLKTPDAGERIEKARAEAQSPKLNPFAPDEESARE